MQTPKMNQSMNTAIYIYNCLVFGSSQTGGLKEDVFSKHEHDKTFKVFCQPGASITTIINKVNDVVENNEVCTKCVDNVLIS